MKGARLILKLWRATSWVTLSSLMVVTGYPLMASVQAAPSVGPSPTNPNILKDPTSPNPVQVDDGYLLGVGDRVRLDIFNVPEYSGEYQILPDGTINLPLVGSVSVRGMTLKQASTELAAKFSRFLRRPIVTVSVTAARPVNIAIAGEVNRPGSYSIAANELTNLTKALQLAGGITRSADVRQIQVRRQRPVDAGNGQIVTVNLWKLLKEGDLRQDILIRDGDTIFIPTAQDMNLPEATQLAAASFSTTDASPIKIAIVGEVNRPGPYTLAGDSKSKVTTVTVAIQSAGGIKQTADIRQIQVHRTTRTGEAKVIQVNLWQLLQGGDLNQDLPLQEGDTVTIPVVAKVNPEEITQLATASFSPNTIRVNVVGEVVRPGIIEVPPNTPLNQVLLAAGGFNDRAQSGQADLVRLNADGSVDKRSLPVDYAQAVSEQSNPPLRNNDTIVVSKSGITSASDTLNILLTPLSPLAGALGFLRIFGVVK